MGFASNFFFFFAYDKSIALLLDVFSIAVKKVIIGSIELKLRKEPKKSAGKLIN